MRIIKNTLHKIIEQLYFHIPNNMALYCRMTGLYNRNWFESIAINKYKHHECYAVLIDLDNFKLVNDTKGHSTGDKVIIHVALLLKSWFISSDVARFGGDEFIVLTYSCPNKRVKMMTETCESLGYSLSYGIAKKEKQDDLRDTVKEADKKMYLIKAKKKENKL